MLKGSKKKNGAPAEKLDEGKKLRFSVLTKPRKYRPVYHSKEE